MSKRRSRLEISLTILKAVKDGVDKPTRIMYTTHLSWTPIQRMLSRLVEQGLIEVRMNTKSRKSKRLYVITEKGTSVLDYFEKAREILPLVDVF